MSSLSPIAPQAVGMSPERLQQLAELAAGWIRPDLHQAIVMLAARRGHIVLQQALGQRDPDAGAPPVGPMDQASRFSGGHLPVTLDLCLAAP